MSLALFAVSALSACQGFNGHAASQCDQSGVLFINWTFAGKPPSAATCAGVDHLTVDISPDDYRCNGLSISPVICDLTRFRYDNVPAGIAHVDLTSYDNNGVPMSQGSTPTLLDTSPSQTVTIDLR